MNNLIDSREERTRKRKKQKRKMDSIIGLSVKDNEKHALRLDMEPRRLSSDTVRLLDEGYFDGGFVIKKGTLEKFLNGQNQYVRGWEYDGEEWSQTEVLNLTEDFVGTVNIGHMDFSTFPFLVGEWKKEDLSLVDAENDRKGLDVAVRLDDESIFVQELKRKDYDIGVSSEFWYHINDADTESLSEMMGYWMPVIDEVFIFAYGLVGECGNVNSSGLELKGDTEMPKETKELAVETPMDNSVTEEENDVIELENDVVEEPIEETVEEPIEETVEEPVKEPVEESVEEDGEEDEVEETVEDGDEDEVDEAYEETLDVIENLKAQVEKLTAEVETLTEANSELKKTNRKLSNKIKNEKEKKEAFIKNAKDVAVKLGVEEEKPQEKKVEKSFALGDGIGD